LINKEGEGAFWDPFDSGCVVYYNVGGFICCTYRCSAATLFWLVQHGVLPAATERACTLPDWLAAKLTGHPPVTDHSLACSWGTYSLVNGTWNLAFLDRLGLDERLFPPVWACGEWLGGPAPDVAEQVGLAAGGPVFNTLGDQQASFLAIVAEPDSIVLIKLGPVGR
jgi:sugar (pentulose or hexulose) kinase